MWFDSKPWEASINRQEHFTHFIPILIATLACNLIPRSLLTFLEIIEKFGVIHRVSLLSFFEVMILE